jgi:hypothetical protein
VIVISNSSPVIALDHFGHLSLLDALFGTVIIPPAVAQEIELRPLPSAIRVRTPARPVRQGLGTDGAKGRRLLTRGFGS